MYKSAWPPCSTSNQRRSSNSILNRWTQKSLKCGWPIHPMTAVYRQSIDSNGVRMRHIRIQRRPVCTYRRPCGHKSGRPVRAAAKVFIKLIISALHNRVLSSSAEAHPTGCAHHKQFNGQSGAAQISRAGRPSHSGSASRSFAVSASSCSKSQWEAKRRALPAAPIINNSTGGPVPHR